MAQATGQIVFAGIPDYYTRITLDDGQGNGHSQVTFTWGTTVGSSTSHNAYASNTNSDFQVDGNASKIVSMYRNRTTNANHVAYLYLNFANDTQDGTFYQDISTGGSTPAILEFKDYDGNTVNITFVNTASHTSGTAVTSASHSRKISAGEYELNTNSSLSTSTFVNELLYILTQARTDGDMSIHASTFLRVVSTYYLQIGAESNGITKAPMSVRIKRASGSWTNTSKDVFWSHLATGTAVGQVQAKINTPDEPVYSILNNSTDANLDASTSPSSARGTAVASYMADIINSLPIQITATTTDGTLSLTNDNHGTEGNTTITSVIWSGGSSTAETTNMTITSFSGGTAEAGSGGSTMSKRVQISAAQMALSGSGGLSGSADDKSALVLDLAGLSAASIAQTDSLAFADADASDAPKKITFSDLEDTIFGNVSGDATIAAGGALTIANDAVEDSMLNDNVAAGLAGAGLAASSGVMSIDLSEYSDVQIASGDKLLVLDSDGSTEQLESIDDIATLFAGAGMTASSAVMAVVNATNGGLSVNANDINVDLNDLAAAAVDASADSIAIIDATDNSTKKESIADLASAMASGTGIVASGGQFAVDGVLEDLDSLGAASADGEFIVATGPGAFAYESGNTARTSLGLGTGDSPQFTGLTLSGDLYVQGSTVTMDVANLQVEDTIIGLGISGSTEGAAGDRGLVMHITGETNPAMFWDESEDEFAFVRTNATGSDTTITADAYADLHVSAMDIDGAMDVAGNSVLNGTLELAGVADAAADVSADSFYFLDGDDNLVKSESMADYATAIAGDGLSATNGVLAVSLSEVTEAVVDVANDSLLFIDANDSNGTRKETWADYATAIAGDGLAASSGVLAMDISEYSDVAVASGDKFLMLDSDGSTHQLESIDDISTFQAGDGLAASSGVLSVQVSGAAVIASDYVGISGSIAGDGLAYAGGVNSISSLSLDISEYSDVAVASGDKFLMLDSDGSTHQLESIDDISSFQAGAGLAATSGVLAVVNATNGGLSVNSNDVNLDLNDLAAATVDVGADSVAIIDATDNSTKKESIADIMTAAAGDGIAASSGVLALDVSEYSDVAVASGDKFLMLDSDGSTHQLESIDDISSFQAGAGLQATSGVLSISQAQQIFASQSDGTTSLALTGGTPAGDVFVFMNGLLLAEGVSADYTISGTTITLAAANAMQPEDEVVVKYIVQ